MRQFLALAFAGRQVFALAMAFDLFVIALLLTGVFTSAQKILPSRAGFFCNYQSSIIDSRLSIQKYPQE